MNLFICCFLTFEYVAVAIRAARFNFLKFYILTTESLYVFCTDLRENSDFCRTAHLLTDFFNPHGDVLLRGTKVVRMAGVWVDTLEPGNSTLQCKSLNYSTATSDGKMKLNLIGYQYELVHSDTALQAEGSRVRFPMGFLRFSLT
jgi:hypothetical protein